MSSSSQQHWLRAQSAVHGRSGGLPQTWFGLARHILLSLLLLASAQFRANAIVPTIQSFEPSSGPVGTQVYIHGSSFNDASSVKFNATAATFTVNTERTTIATTVPAGATTGPLIVTTPGGVVSSSASFTVTNPETLPVIQSFSPASGPVNTEVVVNGIRLGGATAVKFGTISATSFTVSPEGTRITTRIPAGATTAKISVTTPAGTAQSANAFTVTFPPEIRSFTPASGPPSTPVTITGVRFDGVTSVQFGSTAVSSFTVNTERTSISTIVPEGAATGKIYVLSTHGSAASGTNFLVTTPETLPIIQGFTPGSGAVGTEVVITGLRLGSATAVKFGSVSATGFTVNAEGTRLVTHVPAGAVTALISVTTPAGTAISTTNFEVIVPLPPSISSLSPIIGPVGSLVKISGANFSKVTGVSFNGAAATYVLNSAAQITAKVPVGATTGKVSVTTAGGTATSEGNFTVTSAKAVSIFGIAPPAGAPGSVVKILGKGFNGATGVKIGGVACSSFTVDSERRILVTVPEGALSGNIVVTAPAGVAETVDNRYTVAPRIASFAPASGAAGTMVKISGVNFTGVSAVTFNGIGAAFTVNTTGQLTAEVPVGAGSGVISVVNAGGTVSSTTSFTVTQ